MPGRTRRDALFVAAAVIEFAERQLVVDGINERLGPGRIECIPVEALGQPDQIPDRVLLRDRHDALQLVRPHRVDLVERYAADHTKSIAWLKVHSKNR